MTDDHDKNEPVLIIVAETTTTTTTKRRSPREWLAAVLRGLWTPTKTRPIGLIAAGAMVLVGGIYLLQRQADEAAARVTAVATLNAQNLYVLELQSWSDNVAARDLCFESVGRSLDARAGWQQLVTILEGANLPEYAAMVQAGPVLSKPPRSTDECGPAPVAPDPPEVTTTPAVVVVTTSTS